SVAYLELMHRLWNQGEPGSQERKDGRKAAALMIGMLLLVGGAGGLPFAEDAEDLIDGAAQLMGYNFSTAKAKQEFLEGLFGRVLADFIDRGVSGLPGAPLDASGRLGMGNLIPGTRLLQPAPANIRDVLEIAGPMGDFANRILEGGKKIASGDIGSGLLEISPGAVRNAAKGVDMLATGMYRDTKGYKVLDTNTLEAAMKMIGFQPASVATIQEANMLSQKAKAFYNLKAQEIRSMWAAGIFEKDQGKVERARQAIADWNRRNPDQPMAIRVPDIMRRVREMSLSKDERIAKTAPKAMRQQMREDLERTRAALD
ncbi:TPA: PLxRFG domain-containing protein, partial [Pseudomonas aeruginosa]